jgi:hypothetical protein
VTIVALDSLPVAETAAAPCLRFRLSPGRGTWHLTEETRGLLGGVFASIAAAVAYAVAEARHHAGSTLVVELGEKGRR